MKRILKYSVITLLMSFSWIAFSYYSYVNGWFHTPITTQNTSQAFKKAVETEIEKEFVGNYAMAVFENGKIVNEFFYSKNTQVNRNTLFQVASLSKFISAMGVMKLVELGKLDLDVPVNSYLSRWKLPPSEFDNNKVTTRRLLSHTAGLTDGLGYSGFEVGTPIQSLEASLTKAADADEGVSGIVKVGIDPGTKFSYSGGGYTLLQLLVEEISGQSFDSFMKENLFIPIGMKSSTYIWDESLNETLCDFYNSNGTSANHFIYTSKAATSLYTTLSDLELFFQFYTQVEKEQSPQENILSKETLKMMKQSHANVLGEDIWGLGTMFYTSPNTDNFIIGHDGKSTPPINTAFRLHSEKGDGIIILETGHPILATQIASEWVFWKTGKIDTMLFTLKQDLLIRNITIGSIILIISFVWIGLYRRKIKSRKQSISFSST